MSSEISTLCRCVHILSSECILSDPSNTHIHTHRNVQTLCVLLRATFEKKLTDMSFDVIDVVIGFDSAECQMRVSVTHAPLGHMHSMDCIII